MRKIALILVGLGMLNVGLSQPVSHPNANWDVNTDQSDEFNQGLDASKWDNNVGDWGTWSWEPENAYTTDTVLALQMVQKTHTRNGKEYYFTSGIIKNKKKITYGYFETRIKASDKGQGTCPAFWLFSKGEPDPTEEGGVKYCEIDAVEIFQIPNQLQRLEMNLHTRILEDGKLVWKRPGQGNTELCHNTWVAPWDPRDDFHTYGVLNRVDSIFWYVDGVLRGSKPNIYWHLPMNVTVSMGLRTPYEKYIDGVRTVMPYPDTNPEPGFPTEMYCDYVRAWNTPPQIIADNNIEGAQFLLDSELNFECYFDAGNTYNVLGDEYEGVSCKLQEIKADGTVVNEIELVDKQAVGKQVGKSTFSFTINDLTPSGDLPEGNSYILKPVFKTSRNGGEDVFLENEVFNIKLVTELVSVHNESFNGFLSVYPNPASKQINVVTNNLPMGATNVVVYNISGVQLYNQSIVTGKNHVINISDMHQGVYIIRAGGKSQKVIIE